jgi:hypothetical protein
LREAAAGGRAQNNSGQARHGAPDKVAATANGSEFSRQIAVDLEADADFDKNGSGPGHGAFLLSGRFVAALG